MFILICYLKNINVQNSAIVVLIKVYLQYLLAVNEYKVEISILGIRIRDLEVFLIYTN